MEYFEQTSERLFFRRCSLKDVPSWAEFFHDRSPLPWLGLDPEQDAFKAADQWINRQLERYQTHGLGHLAAVRKADDVFIGMGGIIPRTLDGEKELEIAYSLLPSYRGMGYATELASTMRDFGQGQFDAERLISIIHPDNLNSKRVAEKAGMSLWKRTVYSDMPVEVYAVHSAST